MTIGHEDGGGGLEANHSPHKTLGMIRGYFRDYEPWIRTYVDVTRAAGLPGVSWEPALQREIEQLYFTYAELTWEPELSWEGLARRYVLRSERRRDDGLIEAYRLALEANAAGVIFGLQPHEEGKAQRVVQMQELLETPKARGLADALAAKVKLLGIGEAAIGDAPASFDLRRSIAMASARLAGPEILGQWH